MAHTFANLLFHVIFGTKERVPSIRDEWRGDLHAYIGGIINEMHGIPIIHGKRIECGQRPLVYCESAGAPSRAILR